MVKSPSALPSAGAASPDVRGAPTCAVAVPPLVCSPQALFGAGYSQFADRCRAVDEPGLAAIAIDGSTGTVIGMHCLLPMIGQPAVATLGRHHKCDIVLGDDCIALRHLAVIVDPLTSWERGAAVPYRVFDLRTTSGITDEHGVRLHAFRADGSAIIRCGSHVIFLLPIGDPADWPLSAEDAWAMLPPRIYFGETFDPRAPLRSRGGPSPSRIIATPAIREAIDAIDERNADWVGSLVITQPNHRAVVHIGHATLADGVLIGRYDRCDLPGADDYSVSRVHGLLVEVAGRHVLADLSSTFGLGRLDCGSQRTTELIDGAYYRVGLSTCLQWTTRAH